MGKGDKAEAEERALLYRRQSSSHLRLLIAGSYSGRYREQRSLGVLVVSDLPPNLSTETQKRAGQGESRACAVQHNTVQKAGAHWYGVDLNTKPLMWVEVEILAPSAFFVGCSPPPQGIVCKTPPIFEWVAWEGGAVQELL